MIDLSTGGLEWLGVGALLILLGALIKYRGWTFLLAGYDSTSEVPEEVVADVAGNTILRIGVAAAALGGLVLVTEVPSYLPMALGVVIVLAVARMVYRLNTYTPTEAT